MCAVAESRQSTDLPSDVRAAFDVFTQECRQFIEQQRSAGKLHPNYIHQNRIKVLETVPTATGIGPSKFQREISASPVWFGVAAEVVNSLRSGSVYENLLRSLVAHTGGEEKICAHAIEALVEGLVSGKELPPHTLARMVAQLRGAPMGVVAHIDVRGIGTSVERLSFKWDGADIHIRQLKIPDFEEPESFGRQLDYGGFDDWPASVLRVERLQGAERTQDSLHRPLLAALRLAFVNPIGFVRVRYGTTEPLLFVTTVFGGELHSPSDRLRDTAVLTPEMHQQTQQFLDFTLPASRRLCDFSDSGALRIAFERYQECVRGAPLERRIAAAIMGLEALFFRDQEIQELSYRLSLRVAKALSGAGIAPAPLKNVLAVSYRIRSLFVHGGHLTASKRKQCEKDAECSLDALVLSTVNALRVSILHLAESGQPKAAFIDLIEDSLLSAERSAELEKLMSRLTPFNAPLVTIRSN